MSALTIDIETVPTAAALLMPYPADERPAPSNYKNPEAIASWRERDAAAWLEGRIKECSLTPRLGRIVCVGLGSGIREPDTFIAATEEEEAPMLESIWSLIGTASTIVTFNGSFDLRFLVVRSLIHGITGSVPIADWFRRYSVHPHFDCRAVLTGWDDRQTGKLAEWAASFGTLSDDLTTGADIFALYQAGEFGKIAAHCKSDVNLTRSLYQRIEPMFGANAWRAA